ncbi:MAG: hypothetical protein DRQ64_02810 [Gammaproteobacteria bacterium]|nr:MAG: hypothetical protein DRQ64_02810 [Gammaproteobacteria bacterium]
MLESMRGNNMRLKNNIDASRNSIEDILSNILLINRYKNKFDYISASGFISSENRLAWIEQIERTANRLQLSNLQYQIDPQIELVKGRYEIPSNVALFQSTLGFETSLLHEGDLVDVVQDLAELSSGLLVVDSCTITRTSDDVGAFNFNAICDMSWYTASYQDKPVLQMGDEI